MKMYIVIKESVPVGFAVVAAAHASLKAYLEFEREPEIEAWLSGPFYKVVCRVSDAEFERAKGAGDFVIVTESKLDDREIALAFKPRDEWPRSFQFFQLYR
jgi:peptidyl-tRNA hydrolase